MAEVKVPVDPAWHDHVLRGDKRTSVSLRRYGKPGDVFKVLGTLFVLEGIERHALAAARDRFWRHEGFPTRSAFERHWTEATPGPGFPAEAPVWVHRFRHAERPRPPVRAKDLSRGGP